MSAASNTQFIRFSLVGTAGFFVDALVLHLATRYGGLGHYAGRVVSYLVAATFTWACNRRYTFDAQRDTRPALQWVKFLAANAVGGLVNYTAYVLALNLSQTVAHWPTIGVAIGSLAGLAVNFTLSRRLVFAAQKQNA